METKITLNFTEAFKRAEQLPEEQKRADRNSANNLFSSLVIGNHPDHRKWHVNDLRNRPDRFARYSETLLLLALGEKSPNTHLMPESVIEDGLKLKFIQNYIRTELFESLASETDDLTIQKFAKAFVVREGRLLGKAKKLSKAFEKAAKQEQTELYNIWRVNYAFYVIARSFNNIGYDRDRRKTFTDALIEDPNFFVRASKRLFELATLSPREVKKQIDASFKPTIDNEFLRSDWENKRIAKDNENFESATVAQIKAAQAHIRGVFVEMEKLTGNGRLLTIIPPEWNNGYSFSAK